jgi:hypothetical protein
MHTKSLANIIAVLQHHHIISQDVQAPAEGDRDLTHADADFLLRVLTEQQPTRIAFYDTEALYDDADYATLLATFAAATQDEWQLADAASVIQAAADEAHTPAYRVTFRHQEHVIEWHIPYPSKWVNTVFTDQVLAFAASKLPGTFLHLPTWDQCALWIYLPHEVAQELQWTQAEFARLEHEHLQRWLVQAFGQRRQPPNAS